MLTAQDRYHLDAIVRLAPSITQRGYVIGERYVSVYVSPETTESLTSSAIVATLDTLTGNWQTRTFTRARDLDVYLDNLEDCDDTDQT